MATRTVTLRLDEEVYRELRHASLPECRVLETEQFQRDLQEITRSGQPAVAAKLRALVYPQLVARPHCRPEHPLTFMLTVSILGLFGQLGCPAF